jgi:hypothetical protein
VVQNLGLGLTFWSVAQVDPNDDTIRRFVARHYRYDSARRERRHVVVAAFDNEPEFLACIRRVTAEIGQRRQRGQDVDAREHASGVVYEPGYLRRAANGHLISRAIKRGIAGLRFEELELPTYIAVFRSEHPRSSRNPSDPRSA